MPALQNVVLTDRATTPIAHTFTPLGVKDDVGTVVESTGVPIGENRFTISMVRRGGKLRGKAVLQVPVVQTETINGVARPTVVRTAYVEVHCTFDMMSTEAERNNAIGMMENALKPAAVLVNDSFVKAQGLY